jgi:hypothetical protein
VPYRLILTIGCILLAGRYLLDSEGSRTGRWTVALAMAASFILPAGLAWYITSVVVQLTISLFVLLRLVWLRTS